MVPQKRGLKDPTEVKHLTISLLTHGSDKQGKETLIISNGRETVHFTNKELSTTCTPVVVCDSFTVLKSGKCFWVDGFV